MAPAVPTRCTFSGVTAALGAGSRCATNTSRRLPRMTSSMTRTAAGLTTRSGTAVSGNTTPSGSGSTGSASGSVNSPGPAGIGRPWSRSGSLGQGHAKEAALVARLHTLGIDARGQRQLQAEQTLWNAGRMVHGVLAARRQLPAPLDDQPVVEQLDLEVVLVDAREVHRDFDGARRLGHVRGGPPARLHEEAEGLVLPRPAERPGLAGEAERRRTIGHASIAHCAHSIVRAHSRLSIERAPLHGRV